MLLEPLLAPLLALLPPAPAAALALAAPLLLLLLVLREWWKVLPFVYHLRCIAHIQFLRLRGWPPLPAADAPLVTRGRVCVSDLDWNMHQNNSCYFLEADVSRYPWIVALLSGAPGHTSPAAAARFGLAMGGCDLFFKREMRFAQRWAMETRCVGFDAKWLYIRQTFFDEARARRGGHVAGGAAPLPADSVFARGLCRLVFKEKTGAEAGKTVPPAEVLRFLRYDVPAGWGAGTCVTGGLFAQLEEAQLAGLKPAAGAEDARRKKAQ